MIAPHLARFAFWAIPILWLAWGTYWCIAASGVKRVARQESVWSRAGHLVPLGVAGALLALPRMSGWLGRSWATPSDALLGLGLAMVVTGLAVAVWARVVLGGNWSGSVTLKEGHEIIRAGPYRWVRHPIYSGLLLAFLGSALARPQWRGLVAVILAGVALGRKLQREEAWLQELFGADYVDYRRTSWALIPYLY